MGSAPACRKWRSATPGSPAAPPPRPAGPARPTPSPPPALPPRQRPAGGRAAPPRRARRRAARCCTRGGGMHGGQWARRAVTEKKSAQPRAAPTTHEVVPYSTGEHALAPTWVQQRGCPARRRGGARAQCAPPAPPGAPPTRRPRLPGRSISGAACSLRRGGRLGALSRSGVRAEVGAGLWSAASGISTVPATLHAPSGDRATCSTAWPNTSSRLAMVCRYRHFDSIAQRCMCCRSQCRAARALLGKATAAASWRATRAGRETAFQACMRNCMRLAFHTQSVQRAATP